MPVQPNSRQRSGDRRAPHGRSLLVCALAGIASLFPLPALAQTFETLEPSWQIADADCTLRIGAHDRTTAEFHDGRVSEHLFLTAGKGSYIHAVLDVPPAPIIAESAVGLWLKADRPGLQLLARVVYPRSRQGRTGEPLSALLAGETYREAGRWQRVGVAELSTLAARQARVLRTQFGDFDEREAYIDALVLNVYGGAGSTELWIDQLELRGWVSLGRGAGTVDAGVAGEVTVAEPGAASTLSDHAPLPEVELRGDVLLEEGRPVALRIIDGNGESLALLRELGFQAVRIAQPATPAELREARQLGIRIISPPSFIAGQPYIGPEHDAVLAWDLGIGLRAADAAETSQLAARLRQADPNRRRLLVAAPQSDIRGYSRLADAVLLQCAPLAGGKSFREFAGWFRQRQQLARPGVPVWGGVPTSPPAALREQVLAMGGDIGELALEPMQLEQAALLEVAGAARGLWFRSEEPLTGTSPAAEIRRRSVQLLNLKLSLIEPWIAAGQPVLDLSSDDPDLYIAALATERAWLVMLFHPVEGEQFVSAPLSSREVSLVVPGVSASADAYRLTVEGIEPLRHRRVTGGVRLTANPVDKVTLLVVSQDPQVIDMLRRRTAEIHPVAARLREELALALMEQTRRVLGGGGGDMFRSAETALAQARRMAAAGDHIAASRSFTQVQAEIAGHRRSVWQQAVLGFPSPQASPAVMLFPALAVHRPTAERFQRGRLSGNLLPAGDLEQLDDLLAAGWTLGENRDNGAHTLVDISSRAPQQGRASLRMAAWPPQGSNADLVELPSVWIATPAMELAPGELVRIHGWVRIDRPVEQTGDGLLLFDSWGGLELAERINVSDGWREFLLYRAAPADGSPLRFYAALSGYGEASLDAITIERLIER